MSCEEIEWQTSKKSHPLNNLTSLIVWNTSHHHNVSALSLILTDFVNLKGFELIRGGHLIRFQDLVLSEVLLIDQEISYSFSNLANANIFRWSINLYCSSPLIASVAAASTSTIPKTTVILSLPPLFLAASTKVLGNSSKDLDCR